MLDHFSVISRASLFFFLFSDYFLQFLFGGYGILLRFFFSFFAPERAFRPVKDGIEGIAC